MGAPHPLDMLVIGAGASGRRHALAARRVAGLRVAGVVDVCPEAAQRLASDLGVRAHANLQEALDAGGNGFILVSTPPADHAALAIAGMRAGRHVLVEKPLVTAPAQLDAVLHAARSTGLYAGAVAQHRLGEAAITLRRAIVTGALGTIRGARVLVQRHRPPSYFSPAADNWRVQPHRSGGGVLATVGFHYLDLACWMLGAPSDIALLDMRWCGMIDVSVRARFRLGGVPCELVARWGDCETRPDVLDIEGSRGRARLAGDRLLGLPAAAPSDRGALHTRQLADFTEAIRGGARPAVLAEDVRRPLALIHALYRAAGATR